MEVYFGWLGEWFDIFYGWMGWVEVYFGWVGVSRGKWGWSLILA